MPQQFSGSQATAAATTTPLPQPHGSGGNFVSLPSARPSLAFIPFLHFTCGSAAPPSHQPPSHHPTKHCHPSSTIHQSPTNTDTGWMGPTAQPYLHTPRISFSPVTTHDKRRLIGIRDSPRAGSDSCHLTFKPFVVRRLIKFLCREAYLDRRHLP